MYDFNELTKLQLQFKNVIVNWIENDLGPQTKLLGLYYAKENLKKQFLHKTVIIIDDDTMYPSNIVDIYENYRQKYENADEVLIFSSSLPRTHGVMLVEGFGSYSFKFNEVIHDAFVNTCLAYSQLDGCKMHDDFVFSSAFQDLGYVPIKVDNLVTLQLLYGYDSDSLHFQEPNFVKSQVCSNNIWHERRQCATLK